MSSLGITQAFHFCFGIGPIVFMRFFGEVELITIKEKKRVTYFKPWLQPFKIFQEKTTFFSRYIWIKRDFAAKKKSFRVPYLAYQALYCRVIYHAIVISFAVLPVTLNTMSYIFLIYNTQYFCWQPEDCR